MPAEGPDLAARSNSVSHVLPISNQYPTGLFTILDPRDQEFGASEHVIYFRNDVGRILMLQNCERVDNAVVQPLTSCARSRRFKPSAELVSQLPLSCLLELICRTVLKNIPI